MKKEMERAEASTFPLLSQHKTIPNQIQMVFAGLKKPEDRASLIAYLKASTA